MSYNLYKSKAKQFSSLIMQVCSRDLSFRDVFCEFGEDPSQDANLLSQSGKVLNYDSVIEEKTTAPKTSVLIYYQKKILSPSERYRSIRRLPVDLVECEASFLIFAKTHAFLLGAERRLMVGYVSQTTGLNSKFSPLLTHWRSRLNRGSENVGK